MKWKKPAAAAVIAIGLVVGGIAAAAPATAESNNTNSVNYSITPDCNAVLYTIQTAETQALYCQIQAGPAHWGGYNGLVDGVMGSNSWAGFQTFLNAHDYNAGAVDGVPGTNTYKAMQRWAATNGYTGAIDGIMGPNSWRGLGLAVKHGFFTD